MNRILQSVLAICLILISCSVVYYFLLYLPNLQAEKESVHLQEAALERNNKAAELKNAAAQQEKLQTCLADADARLRNIDTKAFNTVESAKILLDFFQKQKDECFKLYSAK